MQTNPESAAVEAVAWLVTTNGLPLRYCRTRAKAEQVAASYGNPTTIEPLYPQSALDALRGEVERLRGRENICAEMYEAECGAAQSLRLEIADRDAVIECKNIDIRERDRSLHEWAERARAAERRVAELEAALQMALEYWAHRQQRYKNRHPAWVVAAREALTKVTP